MNVTDSTTCRLASMTGEEIGAACQAYVAEGVASTAEEQAIIDQRLIELASRPHDLMAQIFDGFLNHHSDQGFIFDHKHSASRGGLAHPNTLSEGVTSRTRPMSSTNGTEILHWTPASRNSRFTVAPRPRTRQSSISFVPKPRREGGVT